MSSANDVNNLEQIEKALKVSNVYYKAHLSSPEAKSYMAERGISAQAAWKFGIGYAPDKSRGLVDHFTFASMRKAAVVGGCLKKQANSDRLMDFFRGRLMFPIMNHNGVLCGFGGRLIKPGPDRKIIEGYQDFEAENVRVKADILIDAATSMFMASSGTFITAEETSRHLVDSRVPEIAALGAAKHLISMMEKDGLIRPAGDKGWRVVPKLPKYLNTSETLLFEKSELLHGFFQNKEEIMRRGEAIAVEGYIDVTTTSSAGFGISVAPMGTSITAQQLALLRDHGVKRLWICLDGDAAGLKAMHRSMDVLLEHYDPTLEVKVILLQNGHDPDSLIRQEGPGAFAAAMESATPLADFIHETCTRNLMCFTHSIAVSMEDKAQYLKELEPFIQKSSGVLRDKLVDMATSFSGLDISDIYALNKLQSHDSLIQQWHPLVLLASRWMLHDDTCKVRASLRNLVTRSEGLGTLTSLAKSLMSNHDPIGADRQLQQYAIAHGPLDRTELKSLTDQWPAWLQKVTMSEVITTIQEDPQNTQATAAFKSMLRIS